METRSERHAIKDNILFNFNHLYCSIREVFHKLDSINLNVNSVRVEQADLQSVQPDTSSQQKKL